MGSKFRQKTISLLKEYLNRVYLLRDIVSGET